MKTREDYLAGKCTHREFYAQLVNEQAMSLVESLKGEILASKDENLNDIPLRQWDNLGTCLQADFKAVGDFRSMGGLVCVLKEAAKQLKEKINPFQESEK